jgi:hypothetical protein
MTSSTNSYRMAINARFAAGAEASTAGGDDQT